MPKRLKSTPSKQNTKTIPIIKDLVLGKLVLASQQDTNKLQYCGTVKVRGKSLEITLYSDNEGVLIDTQKHARKHIRGNLRMLKAAKAFVSVDFVPKYNRQLRKQYKLGLDNQDFPLLDSSVFLETMNLESIVVHANGNCSYWFDVEDQLQGHGLVLYYDAKKGFHEVDTPG